MIGLRTAVTLLALGGSLLAAVPLHLVWWSTARESTRELAGVLSSQIASAVRREWWERIVAAETTYQVADRLLTVIPEDVNSGRALTLALTASVVPSAIALQRDAAADTTVVWREPNEGMRMQVVSDPRIDRARVTSADRPRWYEVASEAHFGDSAVAYAGEIEGRGLLAVYIRMTRFAALLGQFEIGRTGGAFVVEPNGAIKVTPTLSGGAEPTHLRAVVQAAGAVVAARPRDAIDIVETRRMVVGGNAYVVNLSPLSFQGWQFVIIVPEADFLSDIDRTTRHLLLGLLAFITIVGLVIAMAGRRLLANPVTALTADLRHVERFELDRITHRPSQLRELNLLSLAVTRMAAGLSDFAKFIPTDLVRNLVADGVRAEPGGETRALTVMFADVAGFTSLSERIGTGVIDIISRYLDVVSQSVDRSGGTIDKFIGDAVMAFWGAPRAEPMHAVKACACALDAISAVRGAGIVDDQGRPLKIRIGLNSGSAVVGNIGSPQRLNYTAIGDTVNLASRLEGTNKVFDTGILISAATRSEAGDAIIVREICDVEVQGRNEPLTVYELLDMSGGAGKPGWADAYEAALEDYRERRFAAAVERLEGVLAVRPDDGPALWLSARCAAFVAMPPAETWSPILVLSSK